jgi:hypothetical protein
LIVVEGDVTIASDVGQIDALLISKEKIIINSKNNKKDSVLTVNGGLIALGKRANITFTSPIFSAVYLNRDMADSNKNNSPVEIINYDPRFSDIFRELFGDVGRVNFSESGIY